ncbi:arylsulfatase J-like [Bolinopsis microptera]|uniref:arylsulfatase J-like n=1 Tax=Bolinopsis microptera TaxID=2820187 RepID=UPI00307B0C5E
MITWLPWLLTLQVITVHSVTQPNIVIMVADDLGWGDVPWHDALTIAPTLNSLAETGIILDRHYVQSTCTPTRAALMTGKYPSRLGLNHGNIYSNEPYGLMANETLIPNYMSELGYSCHAVGKWHLGFCSWDLTPVKRGFDSFYGFYNGQESYYNKTTHNGFDFRLDTPGDNGTVNSEVLWSAKSTYSTILYANRAAKVVHDHNQSKPLFLYLAMQSVHGPNEFLEKHYQMYKGIELNCKRRRFLSMVTAMDDAAEVVVKALKQSGMWENTIFIFFSDNGGAVGSKGIGQVNYPLRGGKASYWEGGIRSSSFIHSPLIPVGLYNREMLHITDWLPTLTHLAACGPEPTNHECTGPDLGDIDGVNQWDAIIGAAKSNRAEFLVNIDPISKNSALRWGPWKLYHGNPGISGWKPPPRVNRDLYEDQNYQYYFQGPHSIMLFDVEADPAEKNEVSEANPDIATTMLKRLNFYQNRTIPPRKLNKDPASHPALFGGVWTPWLGSC